MINATSSLYMSLSKKVSEFLQSHRKMSRTAKPVVVINQRHLPKELPELIAYNDSHYEIGEYMMKKVPGVLAFFQSNDVSDRSLVHDVQIFNSIESFMAHADMENEELKGKLMNWIPKYDMSIPFKGHVFGAWNDAVKKMTVEVGNANFQFVPRSVGFIKQTADMLQGPPVIVYNHRKVLKGKMQAMLDAMESYADYMYEHVPGVMAITCGIDDKDPLLVHDLQIFANFEVFVGHADMKNPKVQKLMMEWINFKKYDASYPFHGEVWAARDKTEMIRKMTSEIGGAKFTIYPIEEIQGKCDLNRVW